jgi:D-xylonolactonase
MKHETTAVWPAELDLGEGPVWDAASSRFLFVDVHGCSVHAWSPGNGSRQSWQLDERIGWLIPRTDGDGFIAGLQSGFARLWLSPELKLEPMGCPHPGEPDVRLNDAKADHLGRIWAGSMNNENPAQADGRLTRLDPSGSFDVQERGIHIANGPCIAQDSSWMLHTDSWKRRIYRYRITPGGVLEDKQLWQHFSASQGTPDGMTIDAQGHIWIAFWGGACVRQFTADGHFMHQIDLPALQITSVAFGGENLDTLLVTRARNGMTAEQLAQYPQSGAVFSIQCGTGGVKPNTFGSVRT